MQPNTDNILSTLSLASSRGDVLRALFFLSLEHCVLRSIERESMIAFSKDQLVALLDRGVTEDRIENIFDLVEKRLFRPLTFSSPESLGHTKFLVLTEEGSSTESADKAFAPMETNFPEWWSVPLPLAQLGKKKLVLNHFALKNPLARSILSIPAASLPNEKVEFIVNLQVKGTEHSIMFRSLGSRVYLLDDVTRDMATAGDIAWWASVGKAVSLYLAGKERQYWRSESGDNSDLALAEESLPCMWEGKLLGYFCIGKAPEHEKNGGKDVFSHDAAEEHSAAPPKSAAAARAKKK
jgi:hypothetical protein